MRALAPHQEDDLRWFDRMGESTIGSLFRSLMETILRDRLARDECESIRRQLVALGVGGLPAGAPRFAAKIVVQPVRADSGLTAALTIVLSNEGSRSASEIRVEVLHSDTRTMAWMENGDAWTRSTNDGSVNPRRLRGLHPLNPDEITSNSFDSPFRRRSEFPVHVDLHLWAQDTPSVSLRAIVHRGICCVLEIESNSARRVLLRRRFHGRQHVPNRLQSNAIELLKDDP